MTQNNNGETPELTQTQQEHPSKARPSYRGAARVFDLTLGWYSLLIVYETIAVLIGKDNFRHVPLIYLSFVFIPISILLDSLSYAGLGGTLGKWLFGVKVVNEDFSKVSAGRYFHRNWRVYLTGLALGILPISLITSIYQCIRLSKGLRASYDEVLRVESIEYKRTTPKVILGAVLYLAIFVGGGLLLPSISK